MQGEVLKVIKTKSRWGGEVYMLCIKILDKGSFKAWIDPKNRNFSKWKEVIENGAGSLVKNLVILNEKKKLIDADSEVVFISNILDN